jgi:hypothetical protein
VVRGVFAGRYVDADDDEQFIESRGGRLVRHHLEPDAVGLLKAAVAGSPSAAPPA